MRTPPLGFLRGFRSFTLAVDFFALLFLALVFLAGFFMGG